MQGGVSCYIALKLPRIGPTYVKPGMRPQIKSPLTNQADIIAGPRRMAIERHSFRRYALGLSVSAESTTTVLDAELTWGDRSPQRGLGYQ
jgi:hypothetical protein